METPEVYLLDADVLAANRARITSGDAALRPAVEALRTRADAALKAVPFSVMNKKLVPPSGDKHYYMSIGPYWWPDPAKKDGLPYIRRDGEVNPERNNDSTDARALSQLFSAVDSLALAYYFTGHEPYARHAAHLLRVWFLDPATKMNPNLDYGQAIPGRETGRGIGIIDTGGIAALADSVALLRASDAWTGADDRGMTAWFGAYLDWLRTSKNGRDEAGQHNNHGTWYDVQVARLALAAGKRDVARDVLEKVKSRRIATQIEPNGSQPHELARTKSFGYSRMNLQAFFELATLGERVGVDLWNYRTPDGRGLRPAIQYLAPYADPNKKWPHPQIGTPPNYGRDLAPLLRRAARVYKDPSFEAPLRTLPAGDTAQTTLLYGGFSN